MKKTSGKNNVIVNRASEKNTVKKWLAGVLAVSTAFTMLSGSAAALMAEETSTPSTEYALAGAGSGQDVTVHFGNDEDKDINIHVNPETGIPESETLAGAGSETEETEIETEAETEPETENVEEKRVYTYEDDKVLVTATLEKADAVPDDAVLRVTPVTSDSNGYNYDAYMDALNDKASDSSSEDNVSDADEKAFTAENTLLYDIAFIVCDYDEDGKPIDGTEREFEPEEGAVSVSITFRQDQLTNEINAESADKIMVGHLPLNEGVRGDSETTQDVTDISKDDITVSPLNADKSIEGEQSVAFITDSFSVYYIGRYDGNKKIQIKFVNNDESKDETAALRRAYLYVKNNSNPNNNHVFIPIDLESTHFDPATGIYTIDEEELRKGSLNLDWGETYSVEVYQQCYQKKDWTYGYDWDPKDGDLNQLVTQAGSTGLVGMYYFTLPEEETDLSNCQIEAKKVPYETNSQATGLYRTALGNAVYYGVTANSYLQHGDTQTNFAVKSFVGNGPVGGNLSNNPGNIVVGDLPERFMQIRDKLRDDSSTIYYGNHMPESVFQLDSHQNLVPMDKGIIDDYVDALINNATPLISQNPLKLTRTKGNEYYIDTVALGENAVLYISLDEVLETEQFQYGGGNTLLNAFANPRGVRINKLPSQTIIFQTTKPYSKVTEPLVLGQMVFDNNGTYDFNEDHNTVSDTNTSVKNDGLGEFCPTVIFNSSTAQNVRMTSSAAGTFIFPNAVVSWDATSCGWLLCKNATGATGEWHNLFREMPEYNVIPGPIDEKTTLKVFKVWKDESDGITDAPDGIENITIHVKRKLAGPVGNYYKVEVYACYSADNVAHEDLRKVVYVKKTNSGTDKIDVVVSDPESTHVYTAKDGADTAFTVNRSGNDSVIHIDDLAQYADQNGIVKVRVFGTTTISQGAAGMSGVIKVPEESYTAPEFKTTWSDPDVYYNRTETLSRRNNWEADIHDLDKEMDIVDRYYVDTPGYWVQFLGYRWLYYVEEDITSSEGFEVYYDNNGGINYGIITVTNKISSTSITVSKKWNDDGDTNDDGDNHNVSIVVSLHRVLTSASGSSLPDEDFAQSITLDKDNSWTKTIDGLAKKVVKKENGVDVLYEYSYYVVEEQVPDGYEVSYDTGDVNHPIKEGDINITNTKLGELVIYKKTNGVHVTPSNTKFTITSTNGFSKEITYDQFTNWDLQDENVVPSYTLTNLKPGNYVVTENGSRTEIGGALHFDNEDNSKYDLLITYKNSNDGENKTGAQAAIGVGSDSHVEIDNDYITTYAMPATGGEGTRRMILLGIMLIAFAGAGFIMVLRRREMTR